MKSQHRTPRSEQEGACGHSKQETMTHASTPCSSKIREQALARLKSGYDCQQESYLRFKERLLRSMQHHDPLQILQMGIFEEYEQFIGIDTNPNLTPQSAKSTIKEEEPNISDFDTVLRSYRLSPLMRVTQLESRSRSCDAETRTKRVELSCEKERKTELVLFANIIQKIKGQTQIQYPCQSDHLTVNYLEQVHNSSLQMCDFTALKEENQGLMRQITELKTQIQELTGKCEQLQVNERVKLSDRELQFLLKEKQMTRKLAQARAQIDTLRASLEKYQESAPPEPVIPSPSLGAQVRQGELTGLQVLRERVQRVGQVRRALCELSGVQLGLCDQ